MKLITEINEEIQYLEELNESTGKKDLFIEGVFLQAELKNRNGRVYPSSIMEKEVKRYVKEAVDKSKAYGELNHPASPTINLDRVSHMIKEIKQDGNDFIGKAKIIDTPMGNIVKSLIKEGANLGVSSRGMGSLKAGKGGSQEVQGDFILATAADIVADPSAPDAFVNGIYEGKEWVWDNGLIKEVDVANIKKQLDKAGQINLEEKMTVAWADWLSKL